jgi:hypothetical protein
MEFFVFRRFLFFFLKEGVGIMHVGAVLPLSFFNKMCAVCAVCAVRVPRLTYNTEYQVLVVIQLVERPWRKYDRRAIDNRCVHCA